MAKDFVDQKARTGIPGGGPKLSRVVNESAFGAAKATERYGYGTQTFGPPPVQNKPQKLGDANNLQDKGYDNIVPDSSWLRGGGGSAEGKPNFDKSKRR